MPQGDYDGPIRPITGTGVELPIIALTANAVATGMQACLDIGMNAYLTKPIIPKDLFDAVYRATRGAKTARAS